MSDEKSRSTLDGMSPKVDGIPVPATTTTTPTRGNRRRRVFRFLVSLFISYNLFVATRNLGAQFLSLDRPHERPHRRPLMGKAAEKLFLDVPDEESCIKASRQFAAEPHRAGSERDLDTAKEFLTFVQNELGIKPPSEVPIFSAGSTSSRHATLMIPKSPFSYAWIDTYYPLMNTPLERNLQALDGDGNVVWEADLEEHADAEDPEAHKYSNTVPTFHGLSKGADVSGKLVYANYGLKEDYDKLVKKGVNLTGAIVLTRYGANFRGIKVQLAQELGAAGVLIYSDVRDDGSVTVENGYDPYPHGPARNPKAVQRGSVQFLSMYPGDPSTPGIPAYENATRTEAVNKPKIPSLPISQENGEKLLKFIEDGWNGTIRLNNQVDEGIMPIWNTMAVIPGYIKDEIVMIGNHRDGAVMGSADPTSGTATLHETIRGFGALLKKGWKPLRTIVIASWDAEEYGLIGSTEWGEDFADFIDKHVVAYLNLDSSVSGSRFRASASPSLAHLVHGAALDIPHPTEGNRTLWDATQDSGKYFGAQGATMDAEAVSVYESSLSAQDELGVGALGSGSDYTVFLQRIGVASMNHGFSGTMTDAVYHYHSVYDSERWEELYADPGFHRHVAVAKHLGLIALRLSGSAVLPLNTTHYAFELESYLDKVEEHALTQSVAVDLSAVRKSIHSLQAASQALDYEKLVAERELKKILKKWHKEGSKLRKLRRKIRKAYCKFQKKVFGKKCRTHHRHSEEWVPDIPHERGVYSHDAAHVDNDMIARPSIETKNRYHGDRRENREERFEIMQGLALHSGMELPSPPPAAAAHSCASADRPRLPHFPIHKLAKTVKRIRRVNQKLVAFERGFISEDGLSGREWYKHVGVSPGRYLGYGATTLPGLTEAITLDHNSTLAKHEAKRLESLVSALVETIRA
ncbi:hypothetical protein GYMLUDRAFT_222344 [Collybiopsis luxurians FD-317 M1]|uniref:Unplaced genomic scaffold GYMLUscaffold_16, whole genome shotgun sequence n=1 Tax=Collybiopsis luxurians FD-317 M1 TaxID=944289 RepID=A0A0D0D235_9AGAR|nr:hypothetical protein GYMLUDRAFT_222344 [Collybiopsis luxurians FD-317 M1]